MSNHSYFSASLCFTTKLPNRSGRHRYDAQRSVPKLSKKYNVRNSDRSPVHSHFIMQALFFRDWIKKFQAIQDALDHVLIRVELRSGHIAPKEDIDDIVTKTKMLMGQSCRVDFDFVESISRTPSGKHLYTICEVK